MQQAIGQITSDAGKDWGCWAGMLILHNGNLVAKLRLFEQVLHRLMIKSSSSPRGVNAGGANHHLRFRRLCRPPGHKVIVSGVWCTRSASGDPSLVESGHTVYLRDISSNYKLFTSPHAEPSDSYGGEQSSPIR